MRILYLIILACFGAPMVYSQSCTITVQGIVLDESTGIPLDLAILFIQETNQGLGTDQDGHFKITALCAGGYHLKVSHVGCEAQVIYLEVAKDTSITIFMHHHTELLNEIVVHGSIAETTTQNVQSVSKEDIVRSANKNLAELLEKISGVASLKNGSGVAKPIIHGLSGNRITILNNGLIQAGQQWGNDHAPEIDPFIADHITVVKGVSSLMYGGNGLGSAILIGQNAIEEDPHLHGQFNYIFQSNGRGHTMNVKMQHYHTKLAWKLTGTYKNSGDTHTPDYFLTNTGKREYNFGLQLDKKISPSFFSKLFMSSFNTELGILRGSHISNVTDLTSALIRDEPFFTQRQFSGYLQSPRQVVHHQLVKWENRWSPGIHTIWNFNVGSQWNRRNEYDVRRSGRSEIPALSLDQWSHFIEATVHHDLGKNTSMRSGLQGSIVDNVNNPETGVLPLIPNYNAVKPSGFFILTWDKSNYVVEIGSRLESQNLQAKVISTTLPRIVLHKKHSFINFSSGIGWKYKLNQNFNVNFNLGFIRRSPEVNELYSFGLHQGVASLEEGNAYLRPERSVKGMISSDFRVHDRLLIQGLAYYHRIQDYIYLEPLQTFRLTIRGAFPVFVYTQSDARLMGMDWLASYSWSDHLKWIGKYAMVVSKNLTDNLGLVYTPPAAIQQSLQYSFSDYKRWKQSGIVVNCKSVFRQKNIIEQQDFLLPPPGYTLFGLELNTTLSIGKNPVKCALQIENLMNRPYRDYLNRLRYFADEAGRNVAIKVNYSF